MFTLVKIEGGRINVFEPQILPVGASAVKRGEALVLASGLLVKCGQEATPTFIALADGESGAEISVGRVQSNQIYEVPAVTGVAVGGKYKLATDALGITATTTTTGGAEVVDIATDTVLVRF